MMSLARRGANTIADAGRSASVRTIAELFKDYKKLFYSDASDKIESLYNGNTLVNFYEKNKHLAVNIIIVSSLDALCDSKLGQMMYVTNTKDLTTIIKEKNILVLVVNLFMGAMSYKLNRNGPIYASQSTIYREIERYIPTTYPTNVLQMDDINQATKIAKFLQKL